MGSSIADKGSECARVFVTIEHENPIPNPYPSSSRKSDMHRSGDPTPSQAGIQMTKAIVDIATPLGISVHDHIIVGKNGHASLKGLKLI